MHIARPKFCRKCREIYDSSDIFVCIFHALAGHAINRRAATERDARELRAKAKQAAAAAAN